MTTLVGAHDHPDERSSQGKEDGEVRKGNASSGRPRGAKPPRPAPLNSRVRAPDRDRNAHEGEKGGNRRGASASYAGRADWRDSGELFESTAPADCVGPPGRISSARPPEGPTMRGLLVLFVFLLSPAVARADDVLKEALARTVIGPDVALT